MRRTLLGLLAAVMVAAPLAVAAPASATGDLDTDHEGRVLVAWSMPAGIPSWPQALAAAVDTNELNLDLLDAQLSALPGCTDYQIDLYDDTEGLDALLAHGVLGDGVVPEPGVVTWKYFTAGTGCYEPPPSIGGKTIGFWTNKNGTAAEAAGGLWAQVVANYPTQTAGRTFAQAQTFIKNATSADEGQSMLLAQFYATALNSYGIAGYANQGVDTDGLLDTGECATVRQFLDAVEAQWASLDTKAERVAVKDVLDRINQDVPLAPLQCNPAT